MMGKLRPQIFLAIIVLRYIKCCWCVARLYRDSHGMYRRNHSIRYESFRIPRWIDL